MNMILHILAGTIGAILGIAAGILLSGPFIRLVKWLEGGGNE
jgi:hypothetical protein